MIPHFMLAIRGAEEPDVRAEDADKTVQNDLFPAPRPLRGPHALCASCISIVITLCTFAAHAQHPANPSLDVAAKSNVGIEGKVLYRAEAELRSRPFNPKAPVVVRIASSAQDGAATLYDLRFIAVKPGRFDLRDAIERVDGKSLTDAPAAIVEIASVLPEDHNGELSSSRGLGFPRLSGYRLALIALGILWLIPIAIAIFRRVTRSKPVPVVAHSDAPLSLADQLRPLVEAAIAGRADVDDLARLERLLIAHWRDRLSLAALSAHEALQRLKQHPQGGDILRKVESWLHRPRDSAEPPPDIAAMLEPYRRAETINLASAQTPSAPSVQSSPRPTPVTTGGAA
jgi:hypothetical protein